MSVVHSMSMYINIHCFIGCWFWSYWWSSSHHSTDSDILWVRSGFESCGAQIQWATWGAWQFAYFCTWWKWWTQWCTGLLWKLHHIQEFWWSGWYSNAHPTQKGWQCTFLFSTCRGLYKIILHCNACWCDYEYNASRFGTLNLFDAWYGWAIFFSFRFTQYIQVIIRVIIIFDYFDSWFKITIYFWH